MGTNLKNTNDKFQSIALPYSESDPIESSLLENLGCYIDYDIMENYSVNTIIDEVDQKEMVLPNNRSMTPTPSIIEISESHDTDSIEDKEIAIPLSIDSMCNDTITTLLTFMSTKDIANFSMTSKFHLQVTQRYAFKTVIDIAYLDPKDDIYHIKTIESKLKYYDNKSYITMTTESKDEYGDDIKQYLLEPHIHQTHEWYIC